MFRRILLAGVVALAAFTSAQTTTTVAPAFGASPTAAPVAPVANPLVPFPNPTTPCQVCANANGAPAQCATAYQGVPGQFCYKWLSAGTTQACCCPASSRCAPQAAQVNKCQCDSGTSTVVVVKKTISPWVWVAVAIGAILLIFAIYWCCCRTVDIIEEPVYVQQGYGQPMYGQPGYAQQGYVQGGPVVVGGPGYGYGGYGGGDVAAGVAVGAAAGMVGGMAMGAAIAGAGHGGYGGGGYAVASDPSAGGGFSGGGDFAGDF